MTKRSFPDVNVWFALAVADHPHHRSARAWWDDDSSLAGFSRLTQLGLLRLLTTASAMGGQPVTNQRAWRVYDSLLSDSRIRLFPELPAIEDLSRSFSRARHASPKLWVDAYLAAHAAANDAIPVTFDKHSPNTIENAHPRIRINSQTTISADAGSPCPAKFPVRSFVH